VLGRDTNTHRRNDTHISIDAPLRKAKQAHHHSRERHGEVGALAGHGIVGATLHKLGVECQVNIADEEQLCAALQVGRHIVDGSLQSAAPTEIPLARNDPARVAVRIGSNRRTGGLAHVEQGVRRVCTRACEQGHALEGHVLAMLVEDALDPLHRVRLLFSSGFFCVVGVRATMRVCMHQRGGKRAPLLAATILKPTHTRTHLHV
jgi:hypothetical protein